MAGREKGVGTTPCPECGTDLKRVALPDGGVTAETCPTCYPSVEKAGKATATVTRERGTTTTEKDES